MGRPATIKPDELLITARRVFARKGFDAATLADIAAELNVTAAAVLRHYPSKQALFTAAMQPRHIEVPQFILDLAATDAAADPRVVLRRLAEQFVPFVQQTLAENLAVYMFSRATSLVLPFDPNDPHTPPRRGLKIVADYFRRAQDAGVLRVRDPRAAALIFMGSLQSYVFNHQVFHVAPPYPLSDYIDALIDVWSAGAFIGGSRGKAKRQAHRHSAGDRDRGGGDAPVHAAPARTARADLLGHTGGTNRRRGVARRRPRDKGPRR